jgi:hypothetical protein
LWSSAPYLQNNSVGIFNGDPAVGNFDEPDPYRGGRLGAFKDGITKMLWPEKRETDSRIGSKIPGPSKILRTTSTSYLNVPAGYLPGELIPWAEWGTWLNRLLPWAFTDEGDLKLGPIPKDTPVNLLANIELQSESTRRKDRLAHFKRVSEVVFKLKKALKSLPENPTDDQARTVFDPLVPDLLSVSKCPDFIVNKGHYFGSNLADDDKHALIEFLKTF